LVPYAKLPALSAEETVALFRELESLAPQSRTCPPRPRRHAPTASDFELAEVLHRHFTLLLGTVAGVEGSAPPSLARFHFRSPRYFAMTSSTPSRR